MEEIITNQQKAEAHALEGMAHYRRKEFELARRCFDLSLQKNPANELTLNGIAYLAIRESMSKLPEGPPKDNSWVILMQNKEYIEANGLLETQAEIEEILTKYTKPNPDDPLNVANIFHNAGRFYIVAAEMDAESSYENYFLASMVLHCALPLYGTGEMNLHHRAAANNLLSITYEKVFGPAAALPFAEQSLILWNKQLNLDPQNPHFQEKYDNATQKILELITEVQKLWSQQSASTFSNHLSDLIGHATEVFAQIMKDERGEASPL